MKIITVIKPTGHNPYPLVRHCYLRESRQPREVESLNADSSRITGVLNGLNAGTVTMHPATDARSLCSDVLGRNALRHVILSAEQTSDTGERETSFNALMALASDWVARYAPSTPHIGICHDDRLSPHIHLLIQNFDASTDGGRLSWSPAQLREMQSLDWVSPETSRTYCIEPGRGQGITQREGTRLPYPRATSLDANAIAKLNNNEINEYIKSGTLAVGRSDKQGNIKSVIYQGRRIRLSTIRQLAQNSRVGAPARHVAPSPRHRNPCMVRVRSLRSPSIG